MLKKLMLSFCILVCLLIAACSSTNSIGSVGELPNRWWEKSRGSIESALRSEGKGYYSNVLAFVGESDSVKNYSKSQALDFAKLDANSKLSEYIITRTTTILRDSVESVLSRETDGSSDEAIERKINEISNNMQSSISVAQFSSFMIEGNHTEEEELNGIKYYHGWVCCTIQDDIVKAIQEIQKEAFETVISAAENYAPVMSKIQEDTSIKIAEVMLNDLGGNSTD